MERLDMDGIVDLADFPQSLVERVAKASGKRSAKAIVRWALESSDPAATARPKKAAPRRAEKPTAAQVARALKESIADEKAGRVSPLFTNSRDALKWLESQ